MFHLPLLERVYNEKIFQSAHENHSLLHSLGTKNLGKLLTKAFESRWT